MESSRPRPTQATCPGGASRSGARSAGGSAAARRAATSRCGRLRLDACAARKRRWAGLPSAATGARSGAAPPLAQRRDHRHHDRELEAQAAGLLLVPGGRRAVRVRRGDRNAAVQRRAAVEVDLAVALVVDAVLALRLLVRPQLVAAADVGREVDLAVGVVVDAVAAHRQVHHDLDLGRDGRGIGRARVGGVEVGVRTAGHLAGLVHRHDREADHARVEAGAHVGELGGIGQVDLEAERPAGGNAGHALRNRRAGREARGRDAERPRRGIEATREGRVDHVVRDVARRVRDRVVERERVAHAGVERGPERLVLLEERDAGADRAEAERRVAVAQADAVELHRAARVGVRHAPRSAHRQIRLPCVVGRVVDEHAGRVRSRHAHRHHVVVRGSEPARNAGRDGVARDEELPVLVVEAGDADGAEGRSGLAEARRGVERVHPPVELHRIHDGGHGTGARREHGSERDGNERGRETAETGSHATPPGCDWDAH